jgi:hypothetical protein
MFQIVVLTVTKTRYKDKYGYWMFKEFEKSEKCTVFLGYTPNNAISIGAVIDEFPDSDLFCFVSSDRSQVAYSARVNWLGINASTMIFKLMSFILAGIQIRRLLRRYQEVSICLPHPEHVLGNYLFFHERVAKRYIYEDGLLNYYDAVLDGRHKSSMRRKLQTGWLLGLPYQEYSGFISGVDARSYDGAFVSHPEKIVRRADFGEVIAISRYQSLNRIGELMDTVLFLDQEIEKILAASTAISLRQTMSVLLSELGGEVLVKPHYEMKSSVHPLDESCVPEEMLRMPAELIIEHIRPKVVVSFLSSALINIKTMYPEIRCISVGSNLHEITINGSSASASELFHDFGVEVI